MYFSNELLKKFPPHSFRIHQKTSPPPPPPFSPPPPPLFSRPVLFVQQVAVPIAVLLVDGTGMLPRASGTGGRELGLGPGLG